jgi:hypothetical protein
MLEKVIKGLEHCICESEYIDDNPCKGCPYFVSDQYGCDRTRMEKDALEMLKKQIPIAPIKGEPGKCPICGYKADHKYCPNCGQAFDWDL